MCARSRFFFTLSASTKYWIRFLVVTNAGDTGVKVKVWEDGDPEPGSWDLEATDDDASQLPAGSAGLYFMAPSTVASPDIQVDEFTGLVWSAYSSSDSATTIDLPTKLSVPKDHLAVAVLENGGNARAGAFWAYSYDGIGNRTGVTKRSGSASESYTTNKLNQITARTNPGVVHVSGYAPENATVLVNDWPVLRDGAYYYAAVEVDNSSGTVVEEITVRIIGGWKRGQVSLLYLLGLPRGRRMRFRHCRCPAPKLLRVQLLTSGSSLTV